MEYKLFGRAVDAEDLLTVLSTKKEVVWIGSEQIPISINKQLRNSGITVYPSEFVFAAKNKVEADNDKIEELWTSGRAFALGWIPPRDLKSPQSAVFISATKHVLLPWFELVGRDVLAGNWKEAVPALRYALVDVLTNNDALQPDQLLTNILHHGCVNYEYATREAITGLAWVHYLSKGPWESIRGLATWAEATWNETDEGEISLGDPRGISWLLKPRTELGYRGPLGEWRAQTKVACGLVEPSVDGLGINTREQPAPTLWKSLRALTLNGIPAILEEKSRALYANGELRSGVYSFLLGGTKLAKLPSRPKMDSGDQATLNPVFHSVVSDKAMMRTSTGEDIPFQRGLLINTVVSNFTGWAASGIAPCKKMFHTLSERVLRGQLTNKEAAAIALESLIGKVFNPYEEVAGPIKNTTRFPFTVTNVSKEPDEQEEFFNVTILGHVATSSRVVKLRGPAKAQTFPYDGIRGFEFPWPTEWADAELLLGAEELKLPKLTAIRGWANLVNRHVVLTEGGEWVDPQDEADFLEWYEGNVKEVEIRWRVGNPKAKRYHDIINVMRIAGRQVDDDGYVTAKVTYIIVPLVFGIESIPASIRGGKTALTPAMYLSATMALRRVIRIKENESDLYNDKWSVIKPSSLGDILTLPWAEFVRKMKKANPDGSAITFIRPSTDEVVYIDWRVIELFSHGDVSPDDTFTVMTRRFLYFYHKAVVALKESGSQPWEKPEDEVRMPSWLEWQKNWKIAASTLPRMRGAMAALGFSGGMLRRMISPARITPFMVSIGLHTIPKGIVMINPETVDDMNIPFKRNGESLLMRFPGDAFAPVRINLSRKAPKGVILCSTIDQQEGTKGDSDGDTSLAADRWTLGSLIKMSEKDRQLIARYFRMLGWNSTINVSSGIELPDQEWDVYWPDEAKKGNYRAAFDRYTMFTDLTNTPIVEWNREVPPYDMTDPLVTKFDVGSYIDWSEQISRFNTTGIGHAYNVWFTATVMMAMAYNRNWDAFRVWSIVAHLAATIYEDVFLAAGPKATQWAFFELLEEGNAEHVDKWRLALSELGIDAKKVMIASKSGDEVEIDPVKYLIIARNIVAGYQSHYKSGYMTKKQKEAMGGYEKYAKTVGMLRAVLSFTMKPSWMARYPSLEEIRECISVIHPDSPIRVYYESSLTNLYPYAVECAKAQAGELYTRSME